MIKLRKLLLEGSERKYILPPEGEIFPVQDHIQWALKNVLNKRYGHMMQDDLDYLIDKIYSDLENMGYLTLVWLGSSQELYVRIRSLLNINPSQMRKINKLAEKIGEEGIYSYVKLTDDHYKEKVLWKRPSMY